jgi:hypothetical protein
MKKRGVSQVVGAVVLVGLTVALIAGIWVIIDSFVSEKLESAESCKNILDKISFNNDYTCFNSTSKEMQISVEFKEIEPTSILIGISYEKNINTFELSKDSKIFPDFYNYDKSTSVSMPESESRRTYLARSNERPESIIISPKMRNTQCDVVDKISELPTCI